MPQHTQRSIAAVSARKFQQFAGSVLKSTGEENCMIKAIPEYWELGNILFGYARAQPIEEVVRVWFRWNRLDEPVFMTTSLFRDKTWSFRKILRHL